MISVITPVINGERHIESCLKTVIEQECFDLEHIIIDGVSRDKTLSIIRKYADKHPNIRWVSEKDTGQSNAMNKGISMARGEIIAILNVDDYYEPHTLNRIQEIVKTLKEPGMVVGNCNVWDAEGKLLYVNKPSKLKLTDLLMGWSINPHPVNPSAYFYHKSLHDIIGPYDEKNHYAMDLDFILKAVKVSTVKYFNETWGNYCFLEGTKTAIDQQRGTAIDRSKELIVNHRKKLPVLLQWRVVAVLGFHQALKKAREKVYRIRMNCSKMFTKTY